jgi:hypothetical protein
MLLDIANDPLSLILLCLHLRSRLAIRTTCQRLLSRVNHLNTTAASLSVPIWLPYHLFAATAAATRSLSSNHTDASDNDIFNNVICTFIRPSWIHSNFDCRTFVYASHPHSQIFLARPDGWSNIQQIHLVNKSVSPPSLLRSFHNELQIPAENSPFPSLRAFHYTSLPDLDPLPTKYIRSLCMAPLETIFFDSSIGDADFAVSLLNNLQRPEILETFHIRCWYEIPCQTPDEFAWWFVETLERCPKLCVFQPPFLGGEPAVVWDPILELLESMPQNERPICLRKRIKSKILVLFDSRGKPFEPEVGFRRLLELCPCLTLDKAIFDTVVAGGIYYEEIDLVDWNPGTSKYGRRHTEFFVQLAKQQFFGASQRQFEQQQQKLMHFTLVWSKRKFEVHAKWFELQVENRLNQEIDLGNKQRRLVFDKWQSPSARFAWWLAALLVTTETMIFEICCEETRRGEEIVEAVADALWWKEQRCEVGFWRRTGPKLKVQILPDGALKRTWNDFVRDENICNRLNAWTVLS